MSLAGVPKCSDFLLGASAVGTEGLVGGQRLYSVSVFGKTYLDKVETLGLNGTDRFSPTVKVGFRHGRLVRALDPS